MASIFFFFFDESRERAEAALDELCDFVRTNYDTIGPAHNDRLCLLAMRARALTKLSLYK